MGLMDGLVGLAGIGAGYKVTKKILNDDDYYYCEKCKRKHNKNSKIGKAHMK